jgi:hypothetical protein
MKGRVAMEEVIVKHEDVHGVVVTEVIEVIRITRTYKYIISWVYDNIHYISVNIIWYNYYNKDHISI